MPEKKISRKNTDEAFDLRPLLKEPDAKIIVGRHELLKLLIEADKALDGDSNDAEHDALYELREAISTILEENERLQS